MTNRAIQTLVCTDDGIEVPAQLSDFTETLNIRIQTIDMTATLISFGLGTTSRVVPYPPNGETVGLPPGHIGLQDQLYRVLDVREEGHHGE